MATPAILTDDDIVQSTQPKPLTDDDVVKLSQPQGQSAPPVLNDSDVKNSSAGVMTPQSSAPVKSPDQAIAPEPSPLQDQNLKKEEISQAPAPSAWDRVKDWFSGKNTEEEQAKAQNILAIARVNNLDPLFVEKNYDTLSKNSKMTGLTPEIDAPKNLGDSTVDYAKMMMAASSPFMVEGAVNAPVATAAMLMAPAAVEGTKKAGQAAADFVTGTKPGTVNPDENDSSTVKQIKEVGNLALDTAVSVAAGGIASKGMQALTGKVTDSLIDNITQSIYDHFQPNMDSIKAAYKDVHGTEPSPNDIKAEIKERVLASGAGSKSVPELLGALAKAKSEGVQLPMEAPKELTAAESPINVPKTPISPAEAVKTIETIPSPKNTEIVSPAQQSALPTPSENSVITSSIEKPLTTEVNQKGTNLGSQSGQAQIPGVDAAAENIKSGMDYIGRSMEMSPKVDDLNYNLETLRTQNAADELRGVQLLNNVNLSPKDAEAIYHHVENPAEPLTPEQQSSYEQHVKPILDARRQLFEKIRNNGIPIDSEGHTTRYVEGKGNMLDRIKEGADRIGQGSLLNKSTGQFKHRTMKAIVDDQGNRQVVAIKDGEVTSFNKGTPTNLGPIKRDLPDPVTEYFDKHVMDSLNAIAKNLGISHARLVSLRNWSHLGTSYTGLKHVETKVATPEAVLLHEIGHQIDEKYGLKKMFVQGNATGLKGDDRANFLKTKEELRKLADLRFEGQEAKASYKSYVRKGEEKVAAMFEALLAAPDKFKEVAPTVYKKFTDFLASKPELKPILDIKRSMVYGSKTVGDKNISGVFVDKNGKKWSIGEATTKEIEANTKLKYHKNILLNELLSYNKLRSIDRAVTFLENLKSRPDFNDMAVPTTGEVPDKWRPVNMPQFRGYAFEPRIADTLDKFYSQLKSNDNADDVLNKVNDFLTTSIFFNPLIHIPNIGNHWTVNRGLGKWFVPKDYVTLAKTSARAIDAVVHQNDDYIKILENGGNMLYHKVAGQRLSDLMLKKMGEELKASPDLAADVAKALGYVNPVNLIKAIYDFSGKATWLTNDVATIQAVFEEMENGHSMTEAIKNVSKHIPDYRMPARVLDSKRLADIMSDRSITMFSRYHYGALKSYGEMIKSIVGQTSMKEKVSNLDKLLMMGLITLVLYPQLDKLAKMVTGNKNGMVRRAGASTVPYNTARLIKGKIDFADYVFSILTPSPLLKFGAEEVLNKDVRTGRVIRRPGSEGEDVFKHAAATVSPLQYYQRLEAGDMTPGKMAQQMAGISTPKNANYTDAEQFAANINKSKGFGGAMSDEQLQQYKVKRQLADDFDKTGNPAALDKAVKDGKISSRDKDSIVDKSMSSPLDIMTKHMAYSDIENILKHGHPSEQEKTRLVEIFTDKIDRKIDSVPEGSERQKALENFKQQTLDKFK